MIKWLSKISQFFLMLALIIVWAFSGWPQIFNFPPKIQEAQAALTYVGGNSATGNSADFNVSLTGLTGGSGSAAAAGDLVIVIDGFVSTANGNPGVSTAGYIEVADLYASDSDDANLSVNWKIMGGTPDTAVTCLGSTSASWGTACVVQVWRGISSTPLDVTTTTAVPANNIGTSVPNAPAITPITSGAIVLAIGVGADAAADTAVTAPTGYGNQVHASVDPSLAVRTSISSKAWSGSGAEDPAVWTGVTTTTAGSWVAATLAIRPATVPGAPTIGTATGGNAQASVTFTPPASDGGSAITGYTVTSSPGSFTGTGSASPIVVTGLTNGTAYTFTVHATNAIGNSSESSASNSVTPATAPTVTTSAATLVTDTTAVLNGNIAATGGANATVRGFAWGTNSALSGGDTATTTNDTGSFGTGVFNTNPSPLTGLTCNTTYYSRAYATNSAGDGLGAISAPFTTSACATITFMISTDVFLMLTPSFPVFATSTLSVDTNNSTGWNVTLSRDDADTTMDLVADATVNIIDQTAWLPGAATTTAGNAVRISSFDSSGDVLAMRVMTASGTASFISTNWWGTTDAYIDNATTLWAGLNSTAKKVGDSSVSSGGSAKLNTVLYYLDVPSTQKSGAYSGGITYTATINP